MSMAAIMKDMSANQVRKALQTNNLTTAALMEMTSHSRGVQPHPRATTTAAPQKGYSGVEGARKLLNDIITSPWASTMPESFKLAD